MYSIIKNLLIIENVAQLDRNIGSSGLSSWWNNLHPLHLDRFYSFNVDTVDLLRVLPSSVTSGVRNNQLFGLHKDIVWSSGQPQFNWSVNDKVANALWAVAVFCKYQLEFLICLDFQFPASRDMLHESFLEFAGFEISFLLDILNTIYT